MQDQRWYVNDESTGNYDVSREKRVFSARLERKVSRFFSFLSTSISFRRVGVVRGLTLVVKGLMTIQRGYRDENVFRSVESVGEAGK